MSASPAVFQNGRGAGTAVNHAFSTGMPFVAHSVHEPS